MDRAQELNSLREQLAELLSRRKRSCGAHIHPDSIRLVEQIESLEERIRELEEELADNTGSSAKE